MTDDLKRFIEGFENEDALRRAVEALLTRMPDCTSVRSTHGASEYGKDIVFCSDGPMGETILNACVIKNDKITGSADSGCGARTVFHQVEQALDTAILDGQGQSRSIARAYVITPHECTPQAMESIKGALERRSGQVAFICGNDLLTKFKRYWPDFLLANVKFLGAHVKYLRDELEADSSVARLLFKEGFSVAQSQGRRAPYVRPRLACTLRTHELKLVLPRPKDVELPMGEQEAARLANSFRNLGNLVASLKRAGGDVADAVARAAFELASDLQEAWISGFNVYRIGPGADPQKLARGRSGISVPLGGAKILHGRSASLLDQAAPLIEKLRGQIALSNDLSGMNFKDNPIRLIGSPDLSNFYIVSDLSRRLPSVVVAAHGSNKVMFGTKLLEQTAAPLLITGPAGYGKTSFCKWNALRDIEALEKRTSKVLPIYIQLHKLDGPLLTFKDAFLPSDELTAIWREIHQPGSTSDWTLRIYLDGLDEVPSHDRQVDIATLAASGASPKTQIIMTARDHVSGPWLSWLRRLEVQPFDDQEVRQLVEKWLEGEPSKVSEFYEKLAQVPSMASLMTVPLLGTLILAVYKHGHESLPESRPRLYEMFVRLLAGGWDAAKNISRGSKFASQTKIAVLSHLAGVLHVEKKRDCSIRDVQSAVQERVSGLQYRFRELLSELIADCLLVPTGSILSFPHLSFQEFLAAKDLVQLQPDRANQRLDAFLKGDDWWREVLTFYVSFQDKPAEMEEWIRSGVARTIHKVGDEIVRSRAVELCGVVQTNFSNFQFSLETRKLLGWFTESSFKTAKAKSPKATAAR
ncbi:MAG: hypothetical protein WAN65_20020 [Candidatus Sulfotelmatobacter sp.]